MPISEENQRLTVTLPREGYRRIAELAKQRGMSLSNFVRLALEEAARRDGVEVDLRVSMGGDRTGGRSEG